MDMDVWSEAWSADFVEVDAVGAGSRALPPSLGGRLFALRECDLSDLPEDAADAVCLAGTILQAYLDRAARLPEA